ncbi:malonate--CoA ligase ACSF3, mitochondrial-like [Saccoglossus kowalevskii]
MAGCIAVPLCSSHPPAQLKYYIQNSTPAVVIGTNDFYDSLQPLCDAENLRSIWLQFNPLTRTYVQSGRNFIPENRSFFSALYRAYSLSWKQTDWEKHDALLIYTSGTTDQPKGVLMTHGNIHAQIQNMTEAWQWSEDDVLLHVLPLHHVHGVTNCLATCLNSAATCVMLPRFDAQQVWEKLTSEQSPVINLFMAVPTIYAKLIEYYNHNYKSPRVQEFIRSVCKENIRLMVSGSAALPTPIMEKWEEITGHVLLERYGMTEIGMALTNPLHGERVADKL